MAKPFHRKLSIVCLFGLFSQLISPIVVTAQRRVDTLNSSFGTIQKNGEAMEEELPSPSSSKEFLLNKKVGGLSTGSSPISGSSELSTALGMLGQGMQVHILGEVGKPGVYRVPPSTRVTEAINMAGGFSEKGSERLIELRKVAEGRAYLLDLYEYKINGNVSQNPFLLENDTIYIPLKKKVIQVEGAINRTGEYEVKNEKNVYDVIKAVGGFTVGASRLDPVKIIRFDDLERKHVWEVERTASELQSFEVKNGDVIVAPHFLTKQNTFDYNLNKLPNDNIFYPSFEDRVFLNGALHRPGPVNFNQHFNLSNYLVMAGGPRLDAKRYAVIVSHDGVKRKIRPKDYETTLVNPGDTILVPQKIFTEQYMIGLFATVASIALTSIALFK